MSKVMSLVRSLRILVLGNIWSGWTVDYPASDKTSAKAVLQLVGAVEGRSHLRSLLPSTDPKHRWGGNSRKNKSREVESHLFQGSMRSKDGFSMSTTKQDCGHWVPELISNRDHFGCKWDGNWYSTVTCMYDENGERKREGGVVKETSIFWVPPVVWSTCPVSDIKKAKPSGEWSISHSPTSWGN